MTTDSPERFHFKANKAASVRILGNKALDDLTIDRVCRKLFAAWGGVSPVDRVKLLPYHYYIINVDPHDKPGSHWLACFTNGKRAYVYDSYGRNIQKLVPQLIKTIHKAGMTLGKTNQISHMEQRGYTSETCGDYSIGWLLVVRDLGITRAKNI